MIDISPKGIDLIAMRDKIITDEAGGFGNVFGGPGGMNEQEVLDLLRNLKAGGGFLSGSITTTDANPGTFELLELENNDNVIISTNIIACCSVEDEAGVFIRNAGYQNFDGSVSLKDQIQDSFTMRDVSDWKVDYVNYNKKIYLRVWGEVGKTIVWSFKSLIVTTIK